MLDKYPNQNKSVNSKHRHAVYLNQRFKEGESSQPCKICKLPLSNEEAKAGFHYCANCEELFELFCFFNYPDIWKGFQVWKEERLSKKEVD
jgi:uncharacterized Zn finger protein (UPF0148 family)